MNATTTSLIQLAAHAEDTGNLARIIVSMVDGSFRHPLRQAILSACHRKLLRLIEEEVGGHDATRLAFLADRIGEIGEKAVMSYHPSTKEDEKHEQRFADFYRWLEAENLLVQAWMNLLWEEEFTRPQTFAELLELWQAKKPPGQRGPRANFAGEKTAYPQIIDGLYIRVIHKLIRLAATTGEMGLAADEALQVHEGRYLLSNVIVPKWLSLVPDFNSLLEFLLWRPNGKEPGNMYGNYWDFEPLHCGMRPEYVDTFCETLAGFCAAETDFRTVTEYLGGSNLGAKQGDNILRRWYPLIEARIVALLETKIGRGSREAHDELLHAWWSLGLRDIRQRLPLPEVGRGIVRFSSHQAVAP